MPGKHKKGGYGVTLGARGGLPPLVLAPRRRGRSWPADFRAYVFRAAAALLMLAAVAVVAATGVSSYEISSFERRPVGDDIECTGGLFGELVLADMIFDLPYDMPQGALGGQASGKAGGTPKPPQKNSKTWPGGGSKNSSTSPGETTRPPGQGVSRQDIRTLENSGQIVKGGGGHVGLNGLGSALEKKSR
ncbi:MAG: hypothetical protein HQ511_06560 [Rhodospirillales bacterium]|nr:hypothetical protein [Rhodospirillales bacterium]